MGRKERVQIYNHLYQKKGGVGCPCTYCGLMAWTMDHVPPLCYVEKMRGAEIEVAQLVKIPACEECNSILGGLAILTIPERQRHVKETLRKRYKKLLRMPKWDESDMDDMDERFKDYIRSWSKKAEEIKARLAWKL